MIWFLRGLWVYKSEILLLVQVLSALRKTAAEITREYIRTIIAMRLKRSLFIVAGEIALFVGALYWNQHYPSLSARLAASTLLWGVTVYNAFELFGITIPEIRAFNKLIKGKVGYAVKYVLEISVMSELMQLNLVFLVLCLFLGVSTRATLGSHFSYTRPWMELIAYHGN